ncbi:PAS domain-containing hybrid sensor histidine kinase/response regulator [Rhodonellum sp.]|uniref:PAS domain-containing hybrid sensor histidine kinase/response regulator n=1 Tax=Rhodonellum sp. TaxID=2231180 RepID=UPI002725E3D8|nr:PAS domain-containing hybrid sensor histidine kinase/response regulator [Rhodonellum sp.]MDO9554827.1 response regulator [Rhodonellum sp.]
MGYSFFQALSENQLESRNEFLAKQVEFASRDIQKTFRSMDQDMVFFVENLEAWTYERTSNEQLAFEKRARRIFNNHRNLVDSIIVVFPNHVVSFHFDKGNNFVRTFHSGLEEIPLNHGNEIRFKSQKNNLQIITKVNTNRFLSSELSNFYLGASAEKLVYIDGKLLGFSEMNLSPGFILDDLSLEKITNDIREGIKGEYEGEFNNSLTGKNYRAVIHQYPFDFHPFDKDFAVIFIQDKKLITSGIYVTYISLFSGLLLLLIFVIAILFQFNRNTQVANKILSQKADEINELFRRQTFLLQESKGFIYFQDAKGEMTSVGKEVEGVLGYQQKEFIKNFKDKISPNYIQELNLLIDESIKNLKEVIAFEFEIQKKNGDWIRVKIFEKLLYDEKGAFLGNVGILTDIQEKYLAEQELIKSENRLRAVLKSLPDIIFIYNNSGIFLDYYIQDQSVLFSPAPESLGKSILEVLPTPLNTHFMGFFEKTVQTGKIQTAEFEIMTKLGKKMFETRLFKLDDDRVMSIARDITGQKLWEKGLKDAIKAADQANKAKSEFLANMSHEIRTPLNGLLGIIGLFENTPLTKDQKDFIQIIKDSGDSLSKIINDILDYSKIEAGMMELKMSVFHFKDEIQKIIKVFSGLSIKKDIELTYQYEGLIPTFIELDKEKIDQILYNLIGNALKFTPQGGKIHVLITGEPFLESNIILHFDIKDSGIGIPKDKLQILARPFVQVDGSNTREFTGTGLGLAISKNFIELMGGELKVDSEENVGSTFSFNILGKIFTKESLIISVKSFAGNTPDLDWKNMAAKYPLKILLVEDNAINLQFMQMLMNQLGYDIEIAKDGYEAIEKVEKSPLDLIFMDIQMPRLNGLKATQIIRKKAGGEAFKIVGLSANAFQEDIAEALASGMNEYLTKPVKIPEIAKVIQSCFFELKKTKGVI